MNSNATAAEMHKHFTYFSDLVSQIDIIYLTGEKIRCMCREYGLISTLIKCL
jgi:hypothetical protein